MQGAGDLRAERYSACGKRPRRVRVVTRVCRCCGPDAFALAKSIRCAPVHSIDGAVL